MSNEKEYRCPRECPGRSPTCHSECERHDKYRAECEKRRQDNWNERLTITEALHKKLNKTVKTRYTKTMGD